MLCHELNSPDKQININSGIVSEIEQIQTTIFKQNTSGATFLSKTTQLSQREGIFRTQNRTIIALGLGSQGGDSRDGYGTLEHIGGRRYHARSPCRALCQCYLPAGLSKPFNWKIMKFENICVRQFKIR